MEIAAYIRLFRRWLWLIGLIAVVTGSITFVILRTQPAQYQASSIVQVGQAFTVQNPTSNLIDSAEKLAETYAVFVKTYPVLDATVNKLQLPFTADYLARIIQVRIVTNTSLLNITVTYTDPVIAADIANELAQQLILHSPPTLTADQQDQVKLLNTEIANAQTQLKNARTQMAAIDAKLQRATVTEIQALTAQRDELANQVNAAQSNIAQFSNTLEALQQQGNANSVQIVDQARIPDVPTGPSIVLSTVLAVLIGAVLAAGLSLVIEYFNDSIRNPAELASVLGINLLGTIPPFGKKSTYTDKLITWVQPRSTIAESYRALRVNLMYMEKESNQEHRKYIVTSSSPAEGKSVTTANLAITFAITGMRVLLIDADLRRPVQHELFGLPNRVGLSSILMNESFVKSNSAPVGVSNGLSNGIINSPQPAAQRSGASGAALDIVRRGDAILGKGLQSDSNQQMSGLMTETLPANADDGQRLVNKKQLLLSALIQKTEIPGLDLVTSGPIPSNPAELLGTAQMQELVHRLSTDENYDVVIFDTPPCLTVSDSSVLANVSKANVILVLEAGRTHRGAAARSVQQLTSLSIPVIGGVLNRLNPRDVDSGYGYYYGYYGYYGPANPAGGPPAPDAKGQQRPGPQQPAPQEPPPNS